jgi:hypothetical protein
MSTLAVTNIQSQSSGTLPSFQDSGGVERGRLCRAFVYFNGISPSINGSFNTTSVTKNSTGNYTINFTNALPDANYTTICSNRVDGDPNENAYNARIARNGIYSTTQVQIVHGYYNWPGANNVYADLTYGYVAVFR